jgi:hypothetical protein
MIRWQELGPRELGQLGLGDQWHSRAGAAAATWFVASPMAVFRRRWHRRRQHWAIGAEVLDGGARSRQENKISWEPVALRIATQAVMPLAMYSSYKRKNSSLREKEDCGGWLVALTPSPRPGQLWPKMAQFFFLHSIRSFSPNVCFC